MNNRQIDALVATNIFGLTGLQEPDPCDCSGVMWYDANACPVPRYSTDIAAAWQYVEKLQSSTHGTHFDLRQIYTGDWLCRFKGSGDIAYYGEACADTAPMAICLAALKAAGVGVGE